MKKTLLAGLATGLLLVGMAGMVGMAQATPFLQLDIEDGTYDNATQTIVSSGSSFTLLALLTPLGADIYDSTREYFISAAVTPMTSANTNLGSFNFSGITTNATSGMIYGNPPLDDPDGSDKDGGDLSPHGIFDTYYTQFMFHFSGATTKEYNAEDTPGGLQGEGTGTYYSAFTVDTSGLAAGTQIHFDLYSILATSVNEPIYGEAVMTCTAGYFENGPNAGACKKDPELVRQITGYTNTVVDLDVDKNAPFSHDAESGGNPVPEPATMLLLGTGLASLACARRKKKA